MTRHLITSALPYINGIKHLGNMVGSMLPADMYARYLRQRGEEVLLVCATDEHGTPAELAAQAAGLPVAEFCAQQHEVQREIYEGFGLSFDVFGRSSSPQNHELTQHVARRLHEHGFIEERTVSQVYSVADGRFLPDRYIIGTCPHCGYESARGDQCESCTRVLDPVDLVDARSAVSGSTELEVRETTHLYLRQSALQPEVESWLAEREGGWPTLASSIAHKWLDEGLHDRAITRDLDWGVPVPADTWPGLAAEGKVFYVWFDAPIEYVGATKEWSDAAPAGEDRDWRSWWYDAPDVRYTQVMAKDNVPFHTVMFPATQLGTREPWTTVDHVKAFSWLTYYGGKFSTSQQRGIFTDAALEILPADLWRYYLLANAPESDDTSFTWELFASSVNNDLANTLGNFVNRVLSFSARRFGPTAPAGGTPGPAEERLSRDVAAALGRYEAHMDALEVRKAAQALRGLWSLGNAYLETTAPWSQVKVDPDAAALTLRTAMSLAHLCSVVSEPFVPELSQTIRSAFDLGADSARWVSPEDPDFLASVPAGTPFVVPAVLVAKITTEDLEGFRARFGDGS